MTVQTDFISKLRPRQTVSSPFNYSTSLCLLFRRRGFFLLLKLLKNAKQQTRTTNGSTKRQCIS